MWPPCSTPARVRNSSVPIDGCHISAIRTELHTFLLFSLPAFLSSPLLAHPRLLSKSVTMDVRDYDHGGWKVIVVASILVFMLVSMLLGRLVSRSLKKSTLQKDDFMLLAATVSRRRSHKLRLLTYNRFSRSRFAPSPLHVRNKFTWLTRGQC